MRLLPGHGQGAAADAASSSSSLRPAQPSGSGDVVCELELAPLGDTAAAAAPVAMCRVRYRLHEDGSLSAAYSLRAAAGLPPLPRVGATLVVPRDTERVEWLGRGPGPSYPDKKSSCVGG